MARHDLEKAVTDGPQHDRLQQAIGRGLPPGPVMVNNPYVALPSKEKVYNEMESLIYHFKLIMHGIQPPVGETYFQVEGGNGEVGFYLVSDGTKNPYRVRCRPPCWARHAERCHPRRRST